MLFLQMLTAQQHLFEANGAHRYQVLLPPNTKGKKQVNLLAISLRLLLTLGRGLGLFKRSTSFHSF